MGYPDGMSESETTSTAADLEALQQLQADASGLGRIEELLDQFNIFEATGFIRQELRHSDFLAFLLDPRGNHGLGDTFVKRLLERVLTVAADVHMRVTPSEQKRWDLDRMTVQREWEHLDILLLDAEHELAIIVENKIGTGEHSDQLQRYLDIVEQHYPGRRIIPLYLTPSGVIPTHKKYLPVSYRVVCNLIDDLTQSRATVMNPDVRTLLAHYTDMLRRNIVGDSEIARLCRQISRKHRRALNLLYEHRSRIQGEVQILIMSLVENEPGLVMDYSSKSEVYFGVEAWDTPALLTNSGGTSSGRMLLFYLWNYPGSPDWNYPGSLDFKLYIAPGPEETRRRLLDMARTHPDIFRVTGTPSSRWTAIYSRPFLNQEMYEEADPVDRDEEIRKRWEKFLKDLRCIEEALRKETWIWEPVESDPV